jgi:hypothetical protein
MDKSKGISLWQAVANCAAEWKFLYIFKVLGNFHVNKANHDIDSHGNALVCGEKETVLRTGEFSRFLPN